uniref:Uncharacterized protein n=1 Tax=Rhizophora mucronata TaxID=61149 RepID=A0A2P2J751_RHIMU
MYFVQDNYLQFSGFDWTGQQ